MSDLAHVAELGVARLGLHHASVYAADTHGLTAGGLDEVDEALADLAGQHHLHHAGGLLVRDAQPVDEFALHAHPGEHIVDIRPTAVHEHHPHADQLQEHDVLHDLGLELFVLHGVPAVLDDDHAVPVLLDIGQGLDQHLGSVHIVHCIHLE